jgi:hypothetical protein
MAWAGLFVTVLSLPGLVLSQSLVTTPIKTMLCQVVASPEYFNGKIVQFRAAIATGPESSTLKDDHCFADLWLSVGDTSTPPAAREFAYMHTFWDFRTPDQLDWKPVPPLLPIMLRKDRAYRRFWKLVDKECKSRGLNPTSSPCPAYTVAATFTGRFDYSDGKLVVTREVESKRIVGIGAARFGHLGGWNSQLALESLSNVAATSIVRRVDDRTDSSRDPK